MENLIVGERYHLLDEYDDVTGIYSPTEDGEKRFTEIQGNNPFIQSEDGSVTFCSGDDVFILVK